MMEGALHIRTLVGPGSSIAVNVPELREGDAVDLFVVPAETPRRRPVAEIVQSLPQGPRSAATWDELERQLEEERDSWDR